MKKSIFILALITLISFESVAQDSDTTETQKFTAGDVMISAGTSMFGSGIVAMFSSRRTGYVLMGSGGVTAIIGIIFNVKNKKYAKKKKKTNR